MIAKVHLATKELGIEGDDYRDFLKAITGKSSTKDMTEWEIGAVLDRLAGLGFRSPRTLAPNQRPSEPQERLCAALWHDLADMGCLKDPSERGLRAFANNLVGIEALEWGTAKELNSVIEALKSWRRRERESRLGTAASK